MTRKAIVFLATGFEEIEAVTAIDILRRAQVEVTVAGIGAKAIKGSRGITIVSDIDIRDARQDYDVYVLPGGSTGADNLAHSPEVAALLRSAAQAGRIIAAICAAPAVVLSPLGLLDGKSATCFPGMQNEFPASARYSEAPVIIDGNIITSRGPGTALVFALAIVEKLVGKETSSKVRKATLADSIS